MGCGQSSEQQENRKKNEEIENSIKKEKQQLAKEVKMLLLGAGESGKSTILKQMTLIHGKGYSEQEKEAFKEIIFSNTVQSMRVILEAMTAMDISLGNSENQKHHDLIIEQGTHIEADDLPAELTAAIMGLWADTGVQACFARSREYQLNDSAK